MTDKGKPKRKKRLTEEEYELLAILGRSIDQIRVTKDKTQMDIAVAINSYPNYVSLLTNGATEPGLFKLLSVCAALEVEPDELLKAIWPAFLKYYKKNQKRG